MNETPSSDKQTGSSLTRRAVAIFILAIVAWFLLHFLIHIAVFAVTIVVIIAAVVGVLWALNTLF